MPSSAFLVTVEAKESEFRQFERSVASAVRAALRAEGAPPGAGLTVLLTGDEDIADYHARFMDLPGPTDVLSWPAGSDGGDGPPYLGDVMVSCEAAQAQAATYGHSWAREVAVLAVHGLLHLLGWDDQTDADRAAMQARVDEIVDQVQPL